MSVSVCLSVRNCSPIFTKMFLHIYGRRSVLLWRRCDMLCRPTSGLMDDVIFAHNGATPAQLPAYSMHPCTE